MALVMYLFIRSDVYSIMRLISIHYDTFHWHNGFIALNISAMGL